MSFLKTYFDHAQVLLLCGGALFLALSVYFQMEKKNRASLLFLVLMALCVFSFAALLDPFLNLWDERFHALVAKNMMHHPLMPTLYEEHAITIVQSDWDKLHIWLHKQPLFLWQIALSFKIFGISEFALRIPDIFLGVVLVLITYRSGKLLLNDRCGYIAALLTITSIYQIELISGRQPNDHNDFSFLVYISLSIWALIEYHFSGNKKWIYLIGAFSGLAILCKWLVGLLVYFGWGVLKMSQRQFNIAAIKSMSVALLITLLISVPWQIFIFMMYPQEAQHEFLYNSLHFSEVLEGHSGDIWFHLEKIKVIYGAFAPLCILPAFFAFYKQSSDKKIYFSLISMVLAIYVFFSIAATKMPSFTIVVSMIVLIAIASLVEFILAFVDGRIKPKYHKLAFGAAIIALVAMRFNLNFLQETHTEWKKENEYTRMLTYNKKLFQSLDLPENAVLFNVRGGHHIEAMFYTGLPAYNYFPTSEQVVELKRKNKVIALFDIDSITIPDFILKDSTVIMIKEKMQGFDIVRSK